jgi:hypothetical protein
MFFSFLLNSIFFHLLLKSIIVIQFRLYSYENQHRFSKSIISLRQIVVFIIEKGKIKIYPPYYLFMTYYPEKSNIPVGLSTSEFIIRPLLVSDVEKDFEAVMATQELNLRWTEGRWPKDGFTLEENRKDLEYHQQMHEERKEFTFTVLSPDEKTCLGCVYFKELTPEIIEELKRNNLEQEYVGIVFFWLRPDVINKKFTNRFFNQLIQWVDTEWEFKKVYYFIRGASIPRDRQVFLEAKLEEKFRVGNTPYYG